MGDWAELGNVLAVYWSLLLGNVVEWYEFTVYGYGARYMKANFFGGSSVGVWLGFACTFVARPLGAIVLGWIGDRWGRSTSVNLSIIGMLLGTCGQGCLPTMHCGIPWLANLGLVLLVILRFIQGLSAAGEIATIVTYLTEVSSKSILSRGISLAYVSAFVGFLSAKFMIYLLEALMGVEQMESWGWRLPFLFAIVPGLIAVIGRRKIPESGMFLAEKNKNAGAVEVSAVGKVKQVMSGYWLPTLLGIGVTTTYGVMTYGASVWIQSYLAKAGMSGNERMLLDLVARGVAFVCSIPIGWAADILGIGFMQGFAAVFTMVLGIPFWLLIATDPLNFPAVLVGYSLGYGIALTLCGCLTYHFLVELYPTEVRNTGMGMTFNIAFAIFGGLSPLVALECAEASWLGPGIFYAISGLIAFCSLIAFRVMEKKGLIKMAHVRKSPYFGPLDRAGDARRASDEVGSVGGKDRDVDSISKGRAADVSSGNPNAEENVAAY